MQLGTSSPSTLVLKEPLRQQQEKGDRRCIQTGFGGKPIGDGDLHADWCVYSQDQHPGKIRKGRKEGGLDRRIGQWCWLPPQTCIGRSFRASLSWGSGTKPLYFISQLWFQATLLLRPSPEGSCEWRVSCQQHSHWLLFCRHQDDSLRVTS